MIATSTILGIDPGAHGAIAVLNENGELLELDMPSTPEANGRTATNVPLLAGIALQSGCALETLSHALAGRSAGPLGVALAMVEGSAP